MFLLDTRFLPSEVDGPDVGPVYLDAPPSGVARYAIGPYDLQMSASALAYGAGLHGDMPQPMTEHGKITGLLFEQEGGAVFVGEITWDSGDRERVVIDLYDGSE